MSHDSADPGMVACSKLDKKRSKPHKGDEPRKQARSVTEAAAALAAPAPASLGGNVWLLVQPVLGCAFYVAVDPRATTVAQLRELVCVKTGLKLEDQVLLLHNKVLGMNVASKQLGQLGIDAGSTVVLQTVTGRRVRLLLSQMAQQDGAPVAPRDQDTVLTVRYFVAPGRDPVPHEPLVSTVLATQALPGGPVVVQALHAHLRKAGVALSGDTGAFYAVLNAGAARGVVLDMASPAFYGALVSAADHDMQVSIGVFQCGAPEKATFQVAVKSLDGSYILLDVAPPTTTADLKALILARKGIPADQQRLIFGPVELNNDATLMSQKVHRDATLHLVLRLWGGGCTPAADTVDFASMLPRDSTRLRVAVAAPDTPKWRCVTAGLTLTGVCAFAECPSHGTPTGKVNIALRFGVCDVARVMKPGAVRCPACVGAGCVTIDTSPLVYNTCLAAVGAVHGDASTTAAAPFKAHSVTTVDNNTAVVFNAKPADGTSGPGSTLTWDNLFLVTVPQSDAYLLTDLDCGADSAAVAMQALKLGRMFGDTLSRFNIHACNPKEFPL